MRRVQACWLFALVAVSAFATSVCSEPVALDLSGPRPVVSIRVNGYEARAVFDTGSMSTVANLDDAQKLGLRNEGALPPPFTGMEIPGAYGSTFRGLKVGSIDVGDVPVAVMATPTPEYAAIVSPSAFGKRIVELNFSDGSLRVCDRSSLSSDSASPYMDGPFSLPALPVVVGDKTIRAHIDSGSTMLLAFPMSYAKQLPLADALVEAGSARGHNGVTPIYKAHLKGTVQVGPLRLENPEVRFTEAAPEPNIGMPLLRQMLITIDPSGKRDWASVASGGGDTADAAEEW